MAQTDLDKRLGPRAAAVVAKYGKTIEYRSLAAATYDPTQGSASSTEAGLTTKAIFAQGKNDYAGGIEEVSGKARLIYVAATPFGGTIPQQGDAVLVDGLTYRIEGVPEVIYSGEQPALYAMMIRT
jgi:hypothetical protein